MTEHAGDGTEHPQVVVLAGSALRSAPLEVMADALRKRGAMVEVVAGVDRRRVDLLKLSFRHRERACYLLCGGPALRPEVLHSIATELEANGVPGHRISSAPCPWDDEDAMPRHAIDRLAAMDVDLQVPGPRPPLPKLPPPRPPVPSGSVPALSASANEPAGLSRVPRAAWAVSAVALLGLIAFAATSLATSDAEADDTDSVRDASVATAEPTETPDAPEPPTLEPAADPAPEPEAQPEPESDPEAVELDVVEAVDDSALVYAALRKQSIRALDILLVSPAATRKRGRRERVAKLNFEDARAHCDTLTIEGVGGWRLPEIGEAQWLSRSNLINSGVYWTATKADAFGTERVTWNPRSKRMRSTNQRWRGGRTVCVRFHNGDDPGPR